jgi:GNAT superfamily N-acetyltransferase
MPDVTFRRHGSASARAIHETVALIHSDAYAARIKSGDPFSGEQAFMQRFDAYTSQGGFDLVVAYTGDEPVGQAWGWPLAPDTRAWDGLLAPLACDFVAETGHRTFAISEIMVCAAWTGQGIAHALHDELLASRAEQRAMLLVRPGNTTAYRIYLRWGWQQAAQLRPSWPDAPIFDVLMLDLPIRAV